MENQIKLEFETKRTYTRLDFSLEEEERLINFVKSNHPLYDPKDTNYKNKKYRARLWALFGKQINRSGLDCSKKWVNIRDIYNRNKRKTLGTGMLGQARKKRNDLMAFLEEVASTNAKATENINNESKRIDEDAQQDSVPPMKKRRSTPNGDPMKILGNISQTFRELVNQVLISKEEQTELDLYFSSICKTVKKLDALEQVKIKMQISQIVNQAELEQLSHSKQNDASTILGNNSTSNQNNSSSHFMNHSVNQNNSSHIRMNQMYPNMN